MAWPLRVTSEVNQCQASLARRMREHEPHARSIRTVTDRNRGLSAVPVPIHPIVEGVRRTPWASSSVSARTPATPSVVALVT
ncbi:hypothetical protein GCM10010171_35890 [Actinokineospora fastidiosa]|uniref:Uncharacterized protein n=1 Tax=Actinokineospora fastidiosa TaxID=1816 RepID=A0A918GIV9_9PSEU|nr:hypothetical protein GCM10010171_35890 [Actinokineospora fastidiosa]